MADGVVQQVVQHPVQLGGISPQARQRRFQLLGQLDLLVCRLLGKTQLRPFQQFVKGAGGEIEFLQPALVAGEVEQVVDQLGQALHFFADGFQQVVFARLGRELDPLAQQAEGHVHAGDRGA
ncbi:hypothetical protein D3C81_1591720 [compost metagenome]